MSESACTSFPPIADPDARVLILGSMPGKVSLRKQQYYAHPQNAFWPIMGDLFGAGPDLPYANRVQRLRTRRVAVWDVLASCRRPGSLDASIDKESAVPNAIPALLASCPDIATVFFNGATPESLYRRFVQREVEAMGVRVETVRLPSTSPAFAGMSRRDKSNAWRCVADAL